MAIRIIDTSDPGFGLVIGSLDTMIIREDVVVNDGVAAIALSSIGSFGVLGATLYSYGTLISQTTGIDFASNAADGVSVNTIVNQATGTILGLITGIRVAGSENVVINDGLIDAGEGISDLGGASRFENGGRIVASSIGVSLGASSTLANSGRIDAGVVGVALHGGSTRLTNQGTIASLLNGIVVEDGSGHSLSNVGRIDAAEVGVLVRVGGNRLINTGDIFSGTEAVVSSMKTAGTFRLDNHGLIASDNGVAYVDAGQAADRIWNYGTIQGSLQTLALADLLENAGTIIGAVDLGDGNDVYRGIGTGRTSGIVSGGAGIDQMAGGALDDRLSGGIDADRLFGRDGDDVLRGDAGADVLVGDGGGDDLAGGDGDDRLFGGDGTDFLAGNLGADLLFGGAGEDELFGGTENDSLVGGGDDDRLGGGAGLDTMAGGSGDDVLAGDDGNDRLKGGEGDDLLAGGIGDDTLNGGRGDDTLSGDKGSDIFVFGWAAGHDAVSDFTDGQDLIDLTAFGLSDYAALVATGALSMTSSGAMIDLADLGGDGTILLSGFDRVLLGAADFLL